MKKYLKFLTLILSAGLLASCNGSSLPYDESSLEDSKIETPYVDYTVPVTKITFNENDKDITLNKGETYQYRFTMEPKRAEAKGVKWVSNDTDVVTIENGVLSAVGGGKTAITVSSYDDLFNDQTLNVEVIVPLADFSLSDVTLGYNKTSQITPTLSPTDSTQNEFEYTSSDNEVATVSGGGLITSKTRDGECDITVKSLALNIEKTLHVTVREPHVTSITIDKSVNRVEVGHEIDLVASVTPLDAYEQEIAFELDESSAGSGLAEVIYNGAKYTLRAYPNLGADETKSVKVNAYNVLVPTITDSLDVEIYQVKADHILVPDIELSNKVSSYQINPAYVDDSDNPVEPSVTNPVYEILGDGADYISVSDTGLVSFLAKGSAQIRITDENLKDPTPLVVDVSCLLVAESVTITGPNKVYIDETIVLTVASDPARDTLSAGHNDISIERKTGTADCVDIDDSDLDTNGTVTITGVSEGTVTLVATIGGVKSQDLLISVEYRPFEENHVYMVGNKKYSSHDSRPGESWRNPHSALELATNVTGEVVDSDFAVRETIELKVGDVWKIRVGDIWKEERTYQETEFGVIGGEYVKNYVFKQGDMFFNSDTNVQVATAGTYTIQYAHYSNSGDWYSILVELVDASLSVDCTNVKTTLHGTYTINASYIEGTLGAVSSDTGVATVSIVGSAIKIYGVAAGETSVTVSDDLNNIVVAVEVSNVEMIDIYFSRPLDDQYKAWKNDINVHYWGGEASTTYPGIPMEHAYTDASGREILKASIRADSTGIQFNGVEYYEGGEYHDQTVDIETGIANNKGFYLEDFVEEHSTARQVGSWNVSLYTIVYDANGGTGRMFNDNAAVDANWALRTNNYHKEGYIFRGWNTAADGSGDSYSNGELIEQNTHVAGSTFTLYAQWILSGSTVDIYFTRPNGGYDDAWAGYTPKIHYWGGETESEYPGEDMSPAYVNENGEQVYTYAVPADTAGILFSSLKEGEYADSTLDITHGIVNNRGFYLTGGDWGHRTTGSWDLHFYTINFDANTGTGTMPNDYAVCNVDWMLKSNGFTKSGYIFEGWNTAADGSGTAYGNHAYIPADTFSEGETLHLYAQWIASGSTKTVYFTRPNGGYDDAWAGYIPKIHYWGGETESTYPGVDMTAAYVNDSGEQVYKYDIPYNTDGIQFVSLKEGQYDDHTVDILSGIQNKKGFYLTEGEWGHRTVGSWDVGFYTINYNSNGGSGSMASDPNAVIDVSWGLAANTFTAPAGKEFAGWNTAADGSGTYYAPSASIPKDSYNDGDSVTLYAQWQEPAAITVYFHTVDTFSDIASVNIKIGDDSWRVATATTGAEQAYGEYKVTYTTAASQTTLNCYFVFGSSQYAHPSKGTIDDPDVYWDTDNSEINLGSTVLLPGESYVLTLPAGTWNHHYNDWTHAWFNYNLTAI